MRYAALALCAAVLLALSGCTQSIYNNYRDIENLEVVQAAGLDAGEEGGVTLSVATGSDASEREPLRLSAGAESLDGAMRELEQLAGRGSLFFSGTGAIVLGEGAAEDAPRWLDAVARSKELRLDTELFVLRGDKASELLTGENAPEDVFAALNALSSRSREYGPAPVPTCVDVTRSLIASGAALAAAIELEEGADGAVTPVPAGFAVLTESGLAGFLTGDAALGAGLFLGGPGISVTELEGGVTAELAGADVSFEPVWGEDGAVTGLEFSVEVRAGVIEAPAGGSFSDEESWASLESELAARVRGWVEAALSASTAEGADFLGLGRSVEVRYPVKYSAMPLSWEDGFAGLDISVSCRAEILNMREYADSPFRAA